MSLLLRHRRLLLTTATLSAAVYTAYRLHRSQTLRRLGQSLSSLSASLSLVSYDLHRFLLSDSDDIPTSLTQLSKLAEAITVGIVRGLRKDLQRSDLDAKDDVLERVLNRIFSLEGERVVAAVSRGFGRGLLEGAGSAEKETTPWWVRFLLDERARPLVRDSIEKFVSTAVVVYLEKTVDVNVFDQMFTAFANPKHEGKLRELAVSVVNGVIETGIETGFRVTKRNSVANSEVGRNSPGWVESVSSTLAVPSNRRLVLDMSGRVSFSMVRSFLDFMTMRVQDSARSSASIVKKEVVGRGMEVVRYASAKSLLVLTICLTFILHLLPGARLSIPA